MPLASVVTTVFDSPETNLPTPETEISNNTFPTPLPKISVTDTLKEGSTTPSALTLEFAELGVISINLPTEIGTNKIPVLDSLSRA
jgi:hypothetical protein